MSPLLSKSGLGLTREKSRDANPMERLTVLPLVGVRAQKPIDFRFARNIKRGRTTGRKAFNAERAFCFALTRGSGGCSHARH